MVRNSLHDRFAEALAAGREGVLSAAAGPGNPFAMPVRYRSRSLEIECILPRWSDLAHLISEDRLPVVMIAGSAHSQWLQVRGHAEPVERPDWEGLLPPLPGSLRPEDLYRLVRIKASRIDIFRPDAGWGSRETLDL